MLGHIKRALRIGQKTGPVLLENVTAATQDPEREQQVRTAVGNLVSSLVELERHSYEVRQKLATLSLTVVNKGRR